jgi:hypothetical protein
MTEERTVELFLYCVGLDPTESDGPACAEGGYQIKTQHVGSDSATQDFAIDVAFVLSSTCRSSAPYRDCRPRVRSRCSPPSARRYRLA